MEAVPWNFFWSSGLSKKDTLHTKTKFWFGKNQMGILLTELRDSIQNFQVQKKKKTRQQKKQGTQTNESKSFVSESSESD